MADSDLEIDVTDVEDGVEVQTIIQGQAATGADDELEFMVQEEVETTTDGDTLTVELDPVDNVIIALQESDPHLDSRGHFEFDPDGQNGGLDVRFRTILPDTGARDAGSPGKRKRGIQNRYLKNSGGVTSKKRPRKLKKGSIRFTNRHIPAAFSGAGVAKEAVREANEVSFDPEKEARKWKKRRVPVKTVDGGKFCVSMWCSGRLNPQHSVLNW